MKFLNGLQADPEERKSQRQLNMIEIKTNRLPNKTVKSLHPWLPAILTSLPCWNWSSRLLDKLIVMAEADAHEG